ncbi:PLP-dependent cysteine synthase family protein [Streptomyces spiramenti]|uniref:Cysteine synthase family protein n=1 Tax=Streptomyces spiramenti TaxID=2720606 RepID=A0ABX1APP5_9ACTN|nr:cysteine synthase family protein [Streptomyces spiramenti]NJP66245.1 cysteine synthase family protein [Streptomyces spiramenti]
MVNTPLPHLPAVPPRPRIAAGVEELIGRTPLVMLRSPGAAPGARVIAKLESANPYASVKDRAALFMVEAAEARGDLVPGGTVIESTSGNTGIALAALAAVRGYRCVVVLPDSATPERVRLLAALGAEVVQTRSEDGFAGAIERAEEIDRATPDGWYVRQHENADNTRAHYETTGPEIWQDTEGRVDVLVMGVGTGGTLSGAGRYLREQNPRLRIVAVEPATSAVLSGQAGGPHSIPGLNGGFVAPTTEVALIDEVLTCTDEQAMETARHLARGQGLFTGISAGAAVHAALAVARRPESAGLTVVTLLPDTGERYASVWSPKEPS